MKLKNFLFLNVLAEETNGTEPNPQPQINYEDLIVKARKEEKEKAEIKINSLLKEKEILTNKNNELLIEVAKVEEQLSALNNGESEKLINSLKEELEKIKAENQSLIDNSVDVDTLKAELEQELNSKYEIKLYKEQQLMANKDNIIEDLVHGDTKEEIDSSIEASKKKFEAMKERILGSIPNVPPVNPSSSNFGRKELNTDDLVNLNPRSPEYKELRAKLGLK